MNPMVPYLTGWLTACTTTKAADAMKVTEIVPEPPDAFVVKLASGVELRVRVAEIPRTRGAA